MKRVLLLLLTLIACGKKQEAAPLKIKNTSALTDFSLSPTGVKAIQNVFDVYSPNGRLNFNEIKNISITSRDLHAFLKKIELDDPAEQTYNADGFFARLGESNRVINWARSHDLHTVSGWKDALSNEFPEAAPESLNQNLELIQNSVLRDVGKNFLGLALKVGAVFNTAEAFQFPVGSQGMNYLTLSYLADASAPDSMFSNNSVSLLKLRILLQYSLLSNLGSERNNAFARKILRVSESHSQRFNKQDIYSRWMLKNLQATLLAYYPSINFKIIEAIYWANKTKAQVNFPAGASWGAEHKFSHPVSFDYLEMDLERQGPDEDLEMWSAMDIFEMSLSNCPDFRTRTKLSTWMTHLTEKIADPSFDLNAEDFCKKLKENYPL